MAVVDVGLPLSLVAAMVLFWTVERHFARGLTTANQFWPRRPRAAGRLCTLDASAA